MVLVGFLAGLGFLASIGFFLAIPIINMARDNEKNRANKFTKLGWIFCVASLVGLLWLGLASFLGSAWLGTTFLLDLFFIKHGNFRWARLFVGLNHWLMSCSGLAPPVRLGSSSLDWLYALLYSLNPGFGSLDLNLIIVVPLALIFWLGFSG